MISRLKRKSALQGLHSEITEYKWFITISPITYLVAVLQAMSSSPCCCNRHAGSRAGSPRTSFPLPGLRSRSRVPARPRGELCRARSRSRADGPGKARAFAGAAASSAADRWQGSALGPLQPAVRSHQTTALRLSVPSGGARGKDPAC